MKAILFDYGAGNLHSLGKALAAAGVSVEIERDPRRTLAGDLLVLPGVGAFGHAAERLAPAREEIARALQGGHPCLGICLGMQMLFERSDEGAGLGLGVVPGKVVKLAARRVPHIGWNQVESSDPIFAQAAVSSVYYAHSYLCAPMDAAAVVATTEHDGEHFAAAVRFARTMGFQFHPEKSSSGGLRLLRAFVESVRSGG